MREEDSQKKRDREKEAHGGNENGRTKEIKE